MRQVEVMRRAVVVEDPTRAAAILRRAIATTRSTEITGLRRTLLVDVVTERMCSDGTLAASPQLLARWAGVDTTTADRFLVWAETAGVMARLPQAPAEVSVWVVTAPAA